MRKLSINDDINNQPKRPNSTINPRTRGVKRTSLISSNKSSNQQLVQSTKEIEVEDDQRKVKNSMKIQQQKRNINVQNYNFYSKNNSLNIHFQEQKDGNLIPEEKGQSRPQSKQLILKQDNLKILDETKNVLHNSSITIHQYIEPSQIMYTDQSTGDLEQNLMKSLKKTSSIKQNNEQKSKMTQSNAFHTKLQPKKQNQKQLLIKCINNEEKQLSCKQIELTKIIQQRHFQDNLFICNNKRHENLNKNQSLQQECDKQYDKLNVSNFNKSFYVQLNNNKSIRNHKNSNESISNGTKKEEHIKDIKKLNQIEIKQDQNIHKSNIHGKQLSFVNKETLHLIVKRLSQSKHNQVKSSTSSLNQSLDVDTSSRLMNSSIQSSQKINSSQTFYNSFCNRNHSLQNNKSSTYHRKLSYDKKQPCIKGVSINRYYKINEQDNILNKQLNTDYSLNEIIPNNIEKERDDLSQRDYQHLLNQNSNQTEEEINLFITNQLNLTQENTDNTPNKIQNNNNISEKNNQYNDKKQFLVTNTIQYQKKQQQLFNSNILQNEFQQIQIDKLQNNSQLLINNEQQNDTQQIQINVQPNQRKSINCEQNMNDKNAILLKKFYENDKKRKNQSFLYLQQSQKSKEGNEKKKAQTSFNFYSQNSQSYNSTMQNFNKHTQSQLVQHDNHIERKVSNMSQDSHHYLETLVFGEYGTLEFAIAKSNTTGMESNFKAEIENKTSMNSENNINQQIENNNPNQMNSLSNNSNEQSNQEIDLDENKVNVESQSIQSLVIDNEPTFKSKYSKRKSSKSYKQKKKQNKLSISKESETVGELISNQGKANKYSKKRSCSVREEPNYSFIERNEDLKERFLKNLNLKSVGNSVFGSQRTIQVNVSSQEDCKSGEGSKPSQAGDIKRFSYLKEVWNSSSKLCNEQNNEQQFCIEEENISIKDQVQNTQNQNNLNNEFIKDLPQNIEKNIIQSQQYDSQLSGTPKGYFNQSFVKQSTPLSYQNNKSQQSNQKDIKEFETFDFIDNVLNCEINQDDEIINSSECIMNHTKYKFDQDYFHKRNSSLPSSTNNQPYVMKNVNNIIDNQQMKCYNTPKNQKSSFSQEINNASLNGTFLPYQQEDQQNIDSSEFSKIIHSNFPHKINSQNFKSKNLTNSQVYSFLLQKFSASSSSSMSQINSGKKVFSLNTSLTDLDQQKNIQNKISKFSQTPNKDTFNSKTLDQKQDNSALSSKIKNQRPSSMSYNNRKSKATYIKKQMDAEDALLPWNDYTYVKYF